jgi:hypothetical protein
MPPRAPRLAAALAAACLPWAALAQAPALDADDALEDATDARLAELLADDEQPPEDPAPERLTWGFADGSSLRLYGWINYGILSFDDGRATDTYGPIDNANSPSRLGLTYTRPSDGWTLGARVEVQNLFFSTCCVNQLNRSGDDFDFRRRDIRWIEANAAHPAFGRVSAGQGSMATDGITLVDFSGTNVVAYSSVGDSASGQFLRFDDPALPIAGAPQVGQVFRGFNGPRRVRLRYDTPAFGDFGAAIAYGRELLSTSSAIRDEDLVDVSLTYGATHGEVEVGAGAGYFWDRGDRRTLSGSVSTLHTPTGLNATLAAAASDTGAHTESYWYAKLGLRHDLWPLGTTAASIDYYDGSDILRRGSDSTSWGLAVVQNVDAITSELWLTYRQYQYEDPTAAFLDASAVYGGIRWRF